MALLLSLGWYEAILHVPLLKQNLTTKSHLQSVAPITPLDRAVKNVQEVWLIPAVGMANVKYDDVMFHIQNNGDAMCDYIIDRARRRRMGVASVPAAKATRERRVSHVPRGSSMIRTKLSCYGRLHG